MSNLRNVVGGGAVDRAVLVPVVTNNLLAIMIRLIFAPLICET